MHLANLLFRMIKVLLLLPFCGRAFSANLWLQLINTGSTYEHLLRRCHEKILFRTETFPWLPKRIQSPCMAILQSHVLLARICQLNLYYKMRVYNFHFKTKLQSWQFYIEEKVFFAFTVFFICHGTSVFHTSHLPYEN